MATLTAELVALTAATMVILSGICLYIFHQYVIMARIMDSSRKIGREDAITDTGGTPKGALIIQKNGLQLPYFRNSIEQEDPKRVDTGFNDPPGIPKQLEEGLKGNRQIPKKMKRLHWQKVDIEADHPVVWNEIANGSLRFDDELIDTLFEIKPTKLHPRFDSSNSTPSAKISILKPPRGSHIRGIALKAIAISRKQILDAVSEGRGLSGDVLEKLSKISPTEEEASKILQFTGNPTKLTEAESFFYHILKAMPTAFTRIDTMFFRSKFNQEILDLKESLQTIELGCKELRAPGIFWKLLEGILKVGNRLNAGTAKGNANGFKLSSLWKLYHVRSNSFWKMGLLNFVVEQVVVAEGKRCVIDTNPRSNDSDTVIENDEKYLMLGLPVLRRLSTDMSNVNKIASINYDNLIGVIPNLSDRVRKIREMVRQSNEGGGFVKEMKEFVEESEEELVVIREEERRVMEISQGRLKEYDIKEYVVIILPIT
ncbi:hypothetical protein L6452_07109 [Arctium lappa]|uniref:Uncharacterized protein n=1 Tax=Arctium lappa TaxID=4217 RepID=A0ACB9EKU7_ARCLA|nr:hypothetical protein L6452_07109 [Arctium lappa]